MCFDPVAAVFFIMMGQRVYTFPTNFLEDSLSVSISSEIVWIEKLDCFHEGIYFLTMVSMETEKGNFSVIATVDTRKKNFFKNLNLIDSNHHCKNSVNWITVG